MQNDEAAIPDEPGSVGQHEMVHGVRAVELCEHPAQCAVQHQKTDGHPEESAPEGVHSSGETLHIDVAPDASAPLKLSAPRSILECLRTRRRGDPRWMLLTLGTSVLIAIVLHITTFGLNTSFRPVNTYLLVPFCVSLVTAASLNVRLRADEIVESWPFLGATAATTMSSVALVFASMIAPLAQTPFGSKFIYFLCLTEITLAMNTYALLSGLQGDIFDVSVGRLIWLCLTRSFRLMDAVTDCGVAVTVYSRLRNAACLSDSSGRDCGPLFAMFTVGCVGGAGTFVIAFCFILVPGATHDPKTYRWLLCLSFVSQLGVLVVTGLLGLRAVGTPPAIDQQLFLTFSALLSVASFVGNLVGARRLLKGAMTVYATAVNSAKSLARSSARINAASEDNAAVLTPP